MDLKQLNALLAVADAGTVTKAARLLHLEQPAVSRQLKLLETELGLTLSQSTAASWSRRSGTISLVRVTSAQAREDPTTSPSYITGSLLWSLLWSRSRKRRRYSGVASSPAASAGSVVWSRRRDRWRVR